MFQKIKIRVCIRLLSVSDLILIHNTGTEPVPYLKEVVDTEVVLGAGLQEDGVQVSGQPLACLSWHLPLVLHKQIYAKKIISSSVPDPWHFGVDPDPDPAIFVIDLQDSNKKTNFLTRFFCLSLFESTFTAFSKIKSQKELQFTYP